jgi:hypothetical protein
MQTRWLTAEVIQILVASWKQRKGKEEEKYDKIAYSSIPFLIIFIHMKNCGTVRNERK